MKIREFVRDANWADISAACDRFIIDNFEEVSREDTFYKTISKTDFANFLTLEVWDGMGRYGTRRRLSVLLRSGLNIGGLRTLRSSAPTSE